MGKPKKPTWEDIVESDEPLASLGTRTQRLKVPGGWLIRTTASDTYSGEYPAVAVALVFVPDVAHGWKL